MIATLLMGRNGAVAVAIAAVLGWVAISNLTAYHHGAAAQAAKQKEATNAAISRGSRAAAASIDPAARGVLDPYTRTAGQ